MDSNGKLYVEGTMFVVESGAHIRCPRCGRDTLDCENPVRNAISRRADAYICSDCGMDEAVRDMHMIPPLPFSKWAVCNLTGIERDVYREKMAEAAADYMVEIGTSRSRSGNYHFEFDEIGKKIGVELPDDYGMVELIFNAVYGKHSEVVSDLETDTDFDFMFYLAYCPNAEDDD